VRLQRNCGELSHAASTERRQAGEGNDACTGTHRSQELTALHDGSQTIRSGLFQDEASGAEMDLFPSRGLELRQNFRIRHEAVST
jgi:hypothetical protein